ncbi:hypothetical protein [Bacillus tequilensis]
MLQAGLSIEGVINTSLVDYFSDGDSKIQTTRHHKIRRRGKMM